MGKKLLYIVEKSRLLFEKWARSGDRVLCNMYGNMIRLEKIEMCCEMFMFIHANSIADTL